MNAVKKISKTGSFFYTLKAALIILGATFCISGNLQAQNPASISVGSDGGNPVPEYCLEPCNTTLSRWFEIIITAPATNSVDVHDFHFHDIYYHTISDLQYLIAPQNSLTVQSWNLTETYGPYPQGHNNYGMEVAGGFYQFHGSNGITIPAGDSGRIILWLQVTGCYTQGGIMPQGYYTMDFDVDYGSSFTNYIMDPATSCGNWNDRQSVTIKPQDATTLQASPNPLQDKSIFTIDLPTEGACSLTLMNVQGQEVMDLMESKVLPAGKHSLSYNLGTLPSGMYFAKLETPLGVKTVRVLKQ